MYDIAIVGGMGPEATVEFFKRIVSMTRANCDQEHIKICVLNDPTIPDRSTYIHGLGPCPLEPIMNNIQNAVQLNCRYFAIPCNTAHYFAEQYSAVEGITFVNMVKGTCAYIKKAFPGKKVCILATTGTLKADVYKKNAPADLPIIYPEQACAEIVMDIIRTIKHGEYDVKEQAARMDAAIEKYVDTNGTVFVLACTELSLLAPYLRCTYVDAMDVLAATLVKKSGYTLDLSGANLKEDCL